MPFCVKCGIPVTEGAVSCPGCGFDLGGSRTAAPSGPGGHLQAFAPGPKLALDPGSLRHPKEVLYLTITAVIGGLVWLLLIWFAWLYLIPLAVVSWLVGQYFKAQIYGNAVRVSEEQFAELHRMAAHMAAELKLSRAPEIFVLSGQGALNAVAMKFLSGRYILVYGELVDLMLRRGAYDDLRMILGHELAHHALGHVSIWKNLLLGPAMLIPFLGAAYGRACELSADRVGMALSGNAAAAQRALLALALGSEALAAKVDPEAFAAQERYVPPVMGFIHELYATHPRMTRRIIELKEYEKRGALRYVASGTVAQVAKMDRTSTLDV